MSAQKGLKKREKILIFTLAMVVLVYLATHFVIYPLATRLTNSVIERDRLTLEMYALDADIANMSALHSAYQLAWEQYAQTIADFPLLIPNEEIHPILTNLSLQNNLKPTALRITDSVVAGSAGTAPAGIASDDETSASADGASPEDGTQAFDGILPGNVAQVFGGILSGDVDQVLDGIMSGDAAQSEDDAQAYVGRQSDNPYVFTIVSATMNMTGSYDSLVRLLDDVDARRYIRITSLSFSASNDAETPEDGRVTLTFELTFLNG